MNSVIRTLAAASLCALASGAHAALVTVDFDGLDGGLDYVNLERPGNFYNGGLGSMGSGPGPDLGVTFLPFDGTSTEPRAICNATFDCAGQGNSLFIFGDKTNGIEHGAVMHIETGFRGVVEFDASISNIGNGASVMTKTDLGDLSNITLKSVRNPDPTDDCGRLQCDFLHYSFDLASNPFFPDDVVAHYIIFYTEGNDALFIDNIRFHDLILPDGGIPPVAVPEPSTALMIGGVGLIGAMIRRRRTATSQMAIASEQTM
jgi:hypothetical protein